ncbi:MAG TPA: [LysW]-lysine hydrolase [Thermomicrobiales bacterium]|nr:[LysW]-lysine hydrolase [Thermomicrobiales bacterium]
MAILTDQTAIELLHDLVAIPSTSTHESDAVTFLTGWMAAHGLRTEIDVAGNAIGTVGTGDRHIVLLGHIDTVPGVIPVRIEDGLLHGRGAVDAKGPLATFAAAAVRAAHRDPGLRITVVGAVGEEHIGSVGARQIATWTAPDYCIIGEPSGWDALCLGYRGSITATYRVQQESRHTAGPGEASAEKVVAFWNALVAETSTRNGESTGFNALTPAIRDIATQHDGLSDEAWVHIGLRLPPGADVEGLLTQMHRWASEGELIVHGIQEGVRSTKQIPLVPPFLRAIRQQEGSPRFTVKLGTSDMTVVGPVWQCPILAYGPGDAALDHTPEERIVLADYLKAVTILTEVLVTL